MPFYKLQQVIPTADNVSANYATNTWHFEAADVASLGLAQVALQAFYVEMVSFFATNVRQTGWTWKAYDDEDPEPRAPVLEGSWDQSTTITGSPLPPEVALCLSFQGTRVSGIPQARRRGRIYLPFLDTSAGGTDGRPTSTVCGALATAGDNLLSASDASSAWAWITYSTVAPGYTTVTDGWVDNEWDTQRRRGRVATARYTFT